MPVPHGAERDRLAGEAATTLGATYAAARADVLDFAEGGRAHLAAIWSLRVSDTIRKIIRASSRRIGDLTAEDLDAKLDAEAMDSYLDTWADNFGHNWLSTVRADLEQIEAEIAVEAAKIMDEAVAAAEVEGPDQSERAANFGAFEAARSSDSTTKTWHTSAGGDTRATHAALDGVTLDLDQRFANGLSFPGAAGPPAETVNCKCYLTFGGGE